MKKKVISIKDMIHAIEEDLEDGKEVAFKPKGRSMLPFINAETDEVIIKKGPIKKYDVVLFEYNDKYILHRIILKKKGVYTLRGDNCISSESDIKKESIIGKVIGIKRKDEIIDVNARPYRLKVKLWVKLHPVIIFLKRIKNRF